MAGIDQLQFNPEYKGISPDREQFVNEAKDTFEELETQYQGKGIQIGIRMKAFILLAIMVGLTAAVEKVQANTSFATPNSRDSELFINNEVFSLTEKMDVKFDKGKIEIKLDQDFYASMDDDKTITLIFTQGDSLVSMRSEAFLDSSTGFNMRNIPEGFSGLLTILIDGKKDGELVQIPKYIVINADGSVEEKEGVTPYARPIKDAQELTVNL